MQMRFLRLISITGLSALTAACAGLAPYARDKDTRPNLHVDGVLTYPTSPLGPLVDEMWRSPEAVNQPAGGTPHAITLLEVHRYAVAAAVSAFSSIQEVLLNSSSVYFCASS